MWYCKDTKMSVAYCKDTRVSVEHYVVLQIHEGVSSSTMWYWYCIDTRV